MKALVLGAGGVGRAIANIASRRSFITELVIADRNLSRAEDAVNRLKDPRFSAAQVNAAELEVNLYSQSNWDSLHPMKHEQTAPH